MGMGELGLVVCLTSIVFPLLLVGGMLWLLIPVRLGFVPWGMGRVYRMVRLLDPWALVGVFLLGALILISELHEFDAGERLVEQGTVGCSMYLILSGEAEVVRRDDGESRRGALLGPGQVFGEIGYIRAIERTTDVRATSPVSALRFDYERLEQDLKFFPNIVAELNFNISAI